MKNNYYTRINQFFFEENHTDIDYSPLIVYKALKKVKRKYKHILANPRFYQDSKGGAMLWRYKSLCESVQTKKFWSEYSALNDAFVFLSNVRPADAATDGYWYDINLEGLGKRIEYIDSVLPILVLMILKKFIINIFKIK